MYYQMYTGALHKPDILVCWCQTQWHSYNIKPHEGMSHFAEVNGHLKIPPGRRKETLSHCFSFWHGTECNQNE